MQNFKTLNNFLKWKIALIAFASSLHLATKTTGVHLEDSSSGSKPWDEEDINDFIIKQLSNPKLYVTKSAVVSSSSSKKLQGGTTTTTKTTTTTSSYEKIITQDFKDQCRVESDKTGECKQKSSSSTCSSCQKNRKVKPQSDKSKSSSDDEALEVSVESSCDVDSDEIQEVLLRSSCGKNKNHSVHFTADSGSDDGDSKTLVHLLESTDGPKKDQRKRIFRKIIPRPLRRSHSAGNAKDISTHENLSEEASGVAEVQVPEEIPDLIVSSSKKQSTKPIRKTSSLDAKSLCLPDDVDQNSGNLLTRPKSRNIARNMKRKLQFLRRRHTDSALSEGASNGKLSHRGMENASKWSTSFESLLTDKQGLALFRGFLKSEFSEENLEFWVACEEYKGVKSNKLSGKAQQIYTDFVAVHSPKQINLDSKTRGNCQSSLTCPTRQTFEDAQKRIQALMEKDSYPRFLQSETYQQLIDSYRS